MKWLLLIAFFAFAVMANAQKMGPDLPPLNHHFHYPNNFYRDSSQKIVSLYQNYRLQSPGVYHAIQDGMSCIVPDMKKSEAMPNAWPVITMPYTKGNMPNPALPPKKNRKDGSAG